MARHGPKAHLFTLDAHNVDLEKDEPLEDRPRLVRC